MRVTLGYFDDRQLTNMSKLMNGFNYFFFFSLFNFASFDIEIKTVNNNTLLLNKFNDMAGINSPLYFLSSFYNLITVNTHLILSSVWKKYNHE